MIFTRATGDKRESSSFVRVSSNFHFSTNSWTSGFPGFADWAESSDSPRLAIISRGGGCDGSCGTSLAGAGGTLAGVSSRRGKGARRLLVLKIVFGRGGTFGLSTVSVGADHLSPRRGKGRRSLEAFTRRLSGDLGRCSEAVVTGRSGCERGRRSPAAVSGRLIGERGRLSAVEDSGRLIGERGRRSLAAVTGCLIGERGRLSGERGRLIGEREGLAVL